MTKREPRRDETRARILAAAVELFSRDGFDDTTVRAIADRVGLTDAALYYHFKSKREILESVWEAPIGGGPARLRPDGPLNEASLGEIVTGSIDLSIRNRKFLRLMNREVLAGDKTALALRNEGRSALRKTLYEHLVTLFEPHQAEVRTESLVTMIMGATIRRQIEYGEEFESAANEPRFRQRIHDQAMRLAGIPGSAGP